MGNRWHPNGRTIVYDLPAKTNQEKPMGPKSKKPTKKLTVGAAVAVLLYALFSLVVGADKEVENAINVAVPFIFAYFTQNDPTPGGVPAA